MTVFGTGKQTRDYVFVEDVVSAMMSVIKKPGLTGTFNVGTGKETDVLTLFKKLAKITCYRKKPKKAPAQPGAPLRSVIDSSHLSAVTGWKPKTKLNAGLKQTVIWFDAEWKPKKGIGPMLRCFI
jgi:nucleoside-diphosphate-sugar epimerase